MLEIEVIAKGNGKIYKIVNITEVEFKKMNRKPEFTYQAYQKGFSRFQNAVVVDFKNYTNDNQRIKTKNRKPS